MQQAYIATRHAAERSYSRNIPIMIAEIIIAFGEDWDAEDGARKYALSRQSMRNIRKAFGSSVADAVATYRKRNVYVVAAGDKIVTVAFSNQPLVH